MQNNKELKKDRIALLENSIATAITQIVSYVLPFLTLPYLSRVLGVEKFGLVFWAQAMVQYFIVFTDFGFNLSAVREIAVCKNDNKQISKIFSSVLCSKLSLVFVSFIVFSFIILAIPNFRDNWKLFYLTFSILWGTAIYPIWFFQGIAHMKYITFMNILTKTLFMIFIFIFVKSDNDYLLVAMFNSLGFIISGSIGIYFAIKRFHVRLRIPRFNDIITELKTSSYFFIGRFSETIFQTTSSFCLGLITNPMTVGYYIAAEKLYKGINQLQVPVTNAIYPYMAKTRDIKFYKRILLVAVIILFFLCIIVYITAPYIVQLFYGTEMLPAYKTLKIFCITLFFAIICGLTRYPFVGALGHIKVVNFSATIAAVIQIVMYVLFYFINKLNITTIAYLTILPELILFSFSAWTIKKYNLFKENDLIKEIV